MNIIYSLTFYFLFFPRFCYPQHYLLNDFKSSIAVVKRGMPIQEKFNYNCVTQSMEFMSGEEILRLEPISQVDTLYLDNHKMIPYGTRFLEVFHQSPEFTLLIDHKRKVKEDGKIGAMGIKDPERGTECGSSYFGCRLSPGLGKRGGTLYLSRRDILLAENRKEDETVPRSEIAGQASTG